METVYHGSREIVEFPEIRSHRYHKDFSWGFYCTKFEEQAVRWSVRMGTSGFVNVYQLDDLDGLRIKRFPGMTEEWLDFIVACRSGKPHNFDVVEGPMADDTIFNYIQDFLNGDISREAFWALAKFRKPTHQISFHTASALARLHFERSYPTNGKKT